jgi:hypothetical protein
MVGEVISTYCTAAETRRAYCVELCKQLGGEWHLNRKAWELAFIAETLESRGLLTAGKRGLGFGVGVERLVSWFASRGCEITATDKADGGWFRASQARLNQYGICDQADFDRLVKFQAVDMNHIPADLIGFDFVWSCCSLDHVGTIRLSKRFVYKAMACLRLGGVAVHTGEYAPQADWRTIEAGPTVIWTRWDMEEAIALLRERGYQVEFNYAPLIGPEDKLREPCGKHHLRLLVGGIETTSFGLAIQKGDA